MRKKTFGELRVNNCFRVAGDSTGKVWKKETSGKKPPSREMVFGNSEKPFNAMAFSSFGGESITHHRKVKNPNDVISLDYHLFPLDTEVEVVRRVR